MDDVFLLYFTMSPPLPPINKQTNKQLANPGLIDIGGLISIASYLNHDGQMFAEMIIKKVYWPNAAKLYL